MPVIEVAHLGEAQKRAYILADNRLAEAAGLVRELLALEVGELGDLGVDLGSLGFQAGELDALLRSAQPGRVRGTAAMRGRKPKPTALKLIDGNPGKRPINGREPQRPAGIPSCPSHLSPTAKAELKRLADMLHQSGLLTQIDRTALAAYRQA